MVGTKIGPYCELLNPLSETLYESQVEIDFAHDIGRAFRMMKT